MGASTLDWTDPLDLPCQGGALTIGNFDGVHLGHQELLATVRAQAEVTGGPAVVLTFAPHPLTLLRPESKPPLLTTPEERTRLLLACGAHHVLTLRTTLELLRLTAREFFDQVILAKLQPRVLVPGFNFGFGRGREGTVETLARFCADTGIGCLLVPPQQLDGAPISSSRVRAALEAGDVQLGHRLLGHPYHLEGRVGHGAERGRTLGFPTANLEEVATVVPGVGVYAGRAHLNEQTFAAAINVGPNPTFSDQARKLEAHLLDFTGDLYGTRLTLEFLARLRDTRPFQGPQELVAQLRQDLEATRRVAAERTGETSKQPGS